MNKIFNDIYAIDKLHTAALQEIYKVPGWLPVIFSSLTDTAYKDCRPQQPSRKLRCSFSAKQYTLQRHNEIMLAM